jgi:hypothetical protein
MVCAFYMADSMMHTPDYLFYGANFPFYYGNEAEGWGKILLISPPRSFKSAVPG